MKPIQLTVLIIWGALLFSLIMYVTMLSVMTIAPKPAGQESLTSIFALPAAIAAVLSFVMRRVMLSGFTSGRLKVDGYTARNQFVAGNLVVFALSEGIGVLGFVNGLSSGGHATAWVPFIGVSVVLLLLHIPLPSRFEPKKDGYLR